jgi:multiple sugar transport system permease protein
MGPLPGRVPVATATTTARPAAGTSIARRRAPAAVRRRRALTAVANHSIAIAVSAIFLTPFAFIVLTALMTQQQALSTHLWPRPFQWSNFARVFTFVPLWRYTYNTVTYAVLATIGTVASCIPVAYALSRMNWRGRQVAFLVVIATLMLPSQVTIVPLYTIFVRLHWVGSLKPLIVPAFFGDAFTIFLLRQFFLTIPEELSDAARVDGGNEFQIMTRVIVPLAKPAILAVALFQFLYAWNDFFGPLLYTGNNPNIWTLAVGLSEFTSIHRSVLWNLQMAASLIFTLPVIILFFLAQRSFVEGVTLTGVKG